MTEEKRGRSFLLPLLVAGFLAALFLLLPLVPQPDLKARLEGDFSKALQLSCQIKKVRFKILPRPTLEVHDLTCSGTGFSLQVSSLNLVVSPLSLLSFSPQVNRLQLCGVLAEIPFNYYSSKDKGKDTPCQLFSGLLEKINSGKEHLPVSLSVNDAVCKLTGIPACKAPLLFSNLEGVWQIQAQNQSENFALTGDLNGGRCSLEVTWYQVESSSAEESTALGKDDAGDRLEISCNLRGVSLPKAEALSVMAFDDFWLADFEKVDLDLDINGNLDGGLRFAGKFSLSDHHLRHSRVSYDSAQLWLQGALKGNFSGFFQNHDGYLNIKNLFLECPESATLFSRGLIRFREPVFVNLVNHIKVDALAQTFTNCPSLDLPGYQCDGRLEGDFKLVGNPFASPVLKLDLKAEKIVLKAETLASESLDSVLGADHERGQSELVNSEEATLEGQSDEPVVGSDWQDGVEKLLLRLAGWQWIVKSDCQIEVLELPGMHLHDLSLVAEKNLVQLEIERLVAHFGREGQVRLSLILDDFLQDPRWQASLVAEKFDLKPFKTALKMTGALDASFVGGGRLGVELERGKGLNLKGKWQLRQGVFFEQPLFISFKNFLERENGGLQGDNFSSFSGEVSLRDKILRLDDAKINFSGNKLRVRGRFFADSQALDFRAQLSDKEKSSLPFHLSGTLSTPKFSASAD